MRINRLNQIEQYIIDQESSSLEELCRSFGISMSTVRRDIALLVDRGTIKKVYGGVTVSPSYDCKINNWKHRGSSQHNNPGQIIGRLAASLVQDGMSIFLDSGITTPDILSYLSGKQNITVITHNLIALNEAAKYPSLRIIALGGTYSSDASAFVGGSIPEELSKMSIDLVFLSASGVTLERGLTSTTYSLSAIKESAVQWNQNLILLADSTKFGRNALLTFCRFRDLSIIVTDRVLPQSYSDGCLLHGVRVLTPESTAFATQAFSTSLYKLCESST